MAMRHTCWAIFLVGMAACGGGASPEAVDREVADGPEPAQEPTAAGAPQAFMDHLRSLCGQAFPGRLALEPPGDEMLTGTELLIAHFRECSGEELRIPFHIELEADQDWDRSRTWVLSPAPGDGLELRHDHREPDGTPSAHTLYGGFTESDGTPTRQDFVSVERTEESGFPRGWRLEIIPGERYSYGTTRRGEWSWRVDFDLARPMEPPPPPWE